MTLQYDLQRIDEKQPNDDNDLSTFSARKSDATIYQ